MTDVVPPPARASWRRALIVLAGLGAAAIMACARPVVRAAPFGDGPFGRPTSRPAAPRPIPEIEEALDPVVDEVKKNQPPMDAFFDPTKRAEAAAKTLPPMRQMVPLLDELIAAIDLAYGSDGAAWVGPMRVRV